MGLIALVQIKATLERKLKKGHFSGTQVDKQ